MLLLTVNGVTGQYLSNTLVSDLIPAISDVSPYLADQSIVGAFGVFSIFGVSCQVGMSLYNVWAVLGSYSYFSDGLAGVMPLAQWGIATMYTFQTDWGWSHPALAMLLLCPGYCLINSKMIVCNFTKMEMEMNSWCFIWFLLFPVNSARKFFYFSTLFRFFTFSVGLVIPQEVVAAYIGLMNLSEYSTFVYCTIGQITKFLDIYCLSIKPKKQVSPSSTQSSSPIHPSKKGD